MTSKGPKIKYTPVKQGKGKELRLLQKAKEITPKEEKMASAPAGFREGLKMKMFPLQNGVDEKQISSLPSPQPAKLAGDPGRYEMTNQKGSPGRLPTPGM